jgi:hypothetical protein
MFFTLNPKLLAFKSLSIAYQALSFCLVFHQKYLFNRFFVYNHAHNSCFLIGNKYEAKNSQK